MRRTFIAGNWKMNLDGAAAVALAKGLAAELADSGEVDVAVCPPHVYLQSVAEVLGDGPVQLGAQNMYHEPEGAFTGEISAGMLLDVGCRYVILGHSERRHILGETNADVNRKVLAALTAGLVPIVCVGETLAEREAERTAEVIQDQVHGSLADVTADQASRLVIAYEPVWAIGTGKVATPEQAAAVHDDLRTLLENRYNAAAAASVRIQYGGSVKPDNAGELLACQNIDGALVGGASLTVDSFLGIVRAAGS